MKQCRSYFKYVEVPFEYTGYFSCELEVGHEGDHQETGKTPGGQKWVMRWKRRTYHTGEERNGREAI